MARQTKSAQGPYRVQKATMAQTALNRGDERMKALRESMFELLQMDEPRKRYDLGEGHPLLGRRMPDLDVLPRPSGPDVVTESGSRRAFTKGKGFTGGDPNGS